MKRDPTFDIPAERLPPGFAESIGQPVAEPATPRPAATIVLLRDGDAGPEVLLLKRHRASGFVPGAYVFAGGRSDQADSDPAFADLVQRLPTDDVPLQYWITAVREAFEEAGVLLARSQDGQWAPDTGASARLEEWRQGLMNGAVTLAELLAAERYTIDLSGAAYFAHWITPEAEPRRYDTRFFAVRVPAGRTVQVDAREMTDALWLSPRAALDRFAEGGLPMVFPTVKTLQQLAPYRSVEEALQGLREEEVEAILPRLVRTPRGVGIVIE